MSDQAPPPTEPAAESLNNSDAPTTNLDGAAVQEAVATDAGIPLDGETAPIATNLEVPAVPIDSEIKDTQMADAPSDQQPPVCFPAHHPPFLDLIQLSACRFARPIYPQIQTTWKLHLHTPSSELRSFFLQERSFLTPPPSPPTQSPNLTGPPYLQS